MYASFVENKSRFPTKRQSLVQTVNHNQHHQSFRTREQEQRSCLVAISSILLVSEAGLNGNRDVRLVDDRFWMNLPTLITKPMVLPRTAMQLIGQLYASSNSEDSSLASDLNLARDKMLQTLY